MISNHLLWRLGLFLLANHFQSFWFPANAWLNWLMCMSLFKPIIKRFCVYQFLNSFIHLLRSISGIGQSDWLIIHEQHTYFRSMSNMVKWTAYSKYNNVRQKVRLCQKIKSMCRRHRFTHTTDREAHKFVTNRLSTMLSFTCFAVARYPNL